jgi:hypothetical protein
MKISDLSIEEQKQIDEAPAGMLKQLGRNIGAAAAGAVGMKNVAANLKGKADVGATANAVYTKFNQYLGTQQKNIKTATGDDLANFLQNTYNYNQAKVPQGVLNKQQAYDVINKMAADGYAQMGAKGGAGAGPAGQQTAQGQTQTTTQTGQSQTGATAQGQPQTTTQTGKASVAKPTASTKGIPQDVQAQLDTLTPTEKKALVGMLS